MTTEAGGGRTRVVVTGLGMVSAAGTGIEAGWEALAEGRSALAEVESFDATAYGSPLAGEARHLPSDPSIGRSFQLLDLALAEVLEDAGWSDAERGDDTGVVLGTSQGSIARAQDIHRGLARRPQEAATEAQREAPPRRSEPSAVDPNPLKP